MPRILIAWEFGGGLGHVGKLRPVVEELAGRGHQVRIVAANAELSRQAFTGLRAEVVRAPQLPVADSRLRRPSTYADILHDSGYHSRENVRSAVAAWVRLIDDFRPCAVAAEYSPTAQLAAEARGVPAVVLGTGFVCPPDVSPLPSLRGDSSPEASAAVEASVLAAMNAALAAHGAKPLDRVGELFSRAAKRCLLTIQDLDHYRPWRKSSASAVDYHPPAVSLPGPVCPWPSGAGVSEAGPRVYVYLRGDDILTALLRGLAIKRVSTLCCAPRIDPGLFEELAGSSVRVSTTPIDLNEALVEADAAVLNGGHGSLYSMMHAGVPMLIVPTTLEQQLNASQIRRLGLGLVAPPGDLNAVAAGLEEVLANDAYKSASSNYSGRLEQLIAARAGTVAESIEKVL